MYETTYNLARWNIEILIVKISVILIYCEPFHSPGRYTFINYVLLSRTIEIQYLNILLEGKHIHENSFIISFKIYRSTKFLGFVSYIYIYVCVCVRVRARVCVCV